MDVRDLKAKTNLTYNQHNKEAQLWVSNNFSCSFSVS